MPFARHGIFPSNKLANDRMPYSLHLIFRNARTVPLGRTHSGDNYNRERRDRRGNIYGKRPTLLLLLSSYLLQPTYHSTCLNSSLCATGTVFQRKLTKEEVVPNMTTAKTWASSDFFFFFWGGNV
jgi:hypothetical protein